MKLAGLCFFMALACSCYGQDSAQVKKKWYTAHFQFTSVGQYHPPFAVKYTGTNSVVPNEGPSLSVTATIFLGARLWKYAAIYINPEVAGGTGLSKVLGIAGAVNGETFRIGSPEPRVYIARAYLRQLIPVGKNRVLQTDDVNQVTSYMPESYVSINIGRFSIADFFDDNNYAHDARQQFLNWALMGNGAWDYAANTRGYTYGAVFEFVKPNWGLRYGFTVVPKQANGSVMNFDIRKAGAHVLEGEYSWTAKTLTGKVRALAFLNMANMGSYKLANQLDTPDVVATEKYSRIKYGFGLSFEQSCNYFIGVFARGGWNDGQTETWMFTEIDRSASAGVSFDGIKWKRNNDNLGVAILVNGISKAHRNYLQKGGNGFILGDGTLNYAPELIGEVYYNFELWKNRLFIAPDYQFVLNPGYNKDRGPVNIFGLRAHAEF